VQGENENVNREGMILRRRHDHPRVKDRETCKRVPTAYDVNPTEKPRAHTYDAEYEKANATRGNEKANEGLKIA
jgi:hypothetical protein